MTTSKSPVDDALHEPVEERVGAIEARDLQVAAPIDHLGAEHASAALAVGPVLTPHLHEPRYDHPTIASHILLFMLLI